MNYKVKQFSNLNISTFENIIREFVLIKIMFVLHLFSYSHSMLFEWWWAHTHIRRILHSMDFSNPASDTMHDNNDDNNTQRIKSTTTTTTTTTRTLAMASTMTNKTEKRT